MLELELEIAATVEGQQYVGKSVAMYFTLANTHNPKAVEFGRKQLAKVVVAIGLSTSQFNTDDLVGLSFVAALTKQAETEFIDFARILTSQGLEAVDRFNNVKEPVFEKEPVLGAKLAELRAQLGGQQATQAAQMAMPTQSAAPTGFPSAAPANTGAFPPPPTGNAAPAMGGFPPQPAMGGFPQPPASPQVQAAPSGFPPPPAQGQATAAPTGFPPFPPQA